MVQQELGKTSSSGYFWINLPISFTQKQVAAAIILSARTRFIITIYSLSYLNQIGIGWMRMENTEQDAVRPQIITMGI